jgi:FtsP/CotA-like multicopper oxidase with cupredoxin domain
MIPALSRLTRRGVLTGLAAVAATIPTFRRAGAVGALPTTIKPGPNGPSFDLTSIHLPAGLRTDDPVRVNVTSNLAVPVALAALGFDGIEAQQPFLNPVLEPGKAQAIDLPLSQSGTFAITATLLGDALADGNATIPVVVEEPSPPQTDQDWTLLIENHRSPADGTATTPDATANAPPAYTVNGAPSFTVPVRTNQRLRLRLINRCHRNPIALQFDDHDVRVIAIDSRPAEPFLARDRRLILAPGTRMDVLVDATQSAGSTSAVQLFDGGGPKRIGQLVYADGAPVRPRLLPPAQPLADVPIKLELASAHRAQLDLGGSDWLRAQELTARRPTPLFRAKRGGTVLLTLTNTTTLPATFHLYGHHFRWLDRLDDGWKPFLLDTMLIDVGQTERIAFRADFPGDWLIENTAMDWSAPRRFQWFAVE